MAVIHCKTAKLFEAAAQLGAVLAGRTDDEEQALAGYGIHLGTAFQLIDDVLDYSASSAELGKNIGDDLAEGIPARLSDDAGLYLCNAALWHLAGLAGKRPFGFVHLPSTPEMVAESLRREGETAPEKCASMGLRLQLAAVRVVLAEAARKALK